MGIWCEGVQGAAVFLTWRLGPGFAFLTTGTLWVGTSAARGGRGGRGATCGEGGRSATSCFRCPHSPRRQSRALTDAIVVRRQRRSARPSSRSTRRRCSTRRSPAMLAMCRARQAKRSISSRPRLHPSLRCSVRALACSSFAAACGAAVSCRCDLHTSHARRSRSRPSVHGATSVARSRTSLEVRSRCSPRRHRCASASAAARSSSAFASVTEVSTRGGTVWALAAPWSLGARHRLAAVLHHAIAATSIAGTRLWPAATDANVFRRCCRFAVISKLAKRAQGCTGSAAVADRAGVWMCCIDRRREMCCSVS